MYLKEHKYTEWVKYSVPIGEREDVHVDAQPDMENCANGIAPQPNATADGVRRMKVPVVQTMTKYLFDHYRLTMYAYLNKSLRRGQLGRLVDFSFTNRKIDREVCTFRSVNYWRIDRLNFWATSTFHCSSVRRAASGNGAVTCASGSLQRSRGRWWARSRR